MFRVYKILRKYLFIRFDDQRSINLLFLARCDYYSFRTLRLKKVVKSVFSVDR